MGKKNKSGSMTRQQRANAQQHRSKPAPSRAVPGYASAPPVRVDTPDGQWVVNIGELDRLLDKASTLMEQGRLDEASPFVVKAMEAAPDGTPMRAKAVWMLGTLFAMKKNWTHAYILHSEAVRLDPTQPEYWFNLGLTCMNRSMIANAGRAWTRCMELDPDDYVAGIVNESLPEIHADIEDHLAGRPHMTLATMAEHEVLYQRSLAYMDEDEVETARRGFLRCTEIDPLHHRSWGNLGAALAVLREFDQAEAALARALSIVPDYEFALQFRKGLPAMRAA